MQNFSDWFSFLTQKVGKPKQLPFPYQEQFATLSELPLVLNVFTGAGKTATAVLGWLWRRRYADPVIRHRTPRRLVYVLPMRTLVEQTYKVVLQWLEKEKEWREQLGLSNEDIELHMLMGGAVSRGWDAHPEKDCIVIGTQDQILSRGLNRGYSMSRYRWVIDFALLNNDCLWVMDEVQLMGAGLQTTAQLQWFREYFGAYGTVHSLWMSATIEPQRLKTVDYCEGYNLDSKISSLTADDLENKHLKQRQQADKQLYRATTVCSGKKNDEESYARTLAKEIANVHTTDVTTLVICNRVSRAQAIHKALAPLIGKENLLLVHSRFRSSDRAQLNKELQDSEGLKSKVVIATQAIEAGVDISATYLFTELAPWSSLVQRIGRCNRYGTDQGASVYWIDFTDPLTDESARPYSIEELEQSRRLLKRLLDGDGKVGPAALESFIEELKQQSPEDLPHREIEGLLPRKHDLLQLFDTSTDLAGHDIDISCFIRDVEDTDVAIAWREWDGEVPPTDLDDPHYRGTLQTQELCRVSVWQAKEFLKKRKAWIFDRLQSSWQSIVGEQVYPGMTLLLKCEQGGYSDELGFTGLPSDRPEPKISKEQIMHPDQDNRDFLSYGAQQFVSLKDHSETIVEEVLALCKSLQSNSQNFDVPLAKIQRAARWHDAGKAHPEFQKILTHNRPSHEKKEIWAKSDHDYSKPKDRYTLPANRRGFRHELASALLALQQNEDFLVAYLAACHHGKVRLTIQPRPTEQAPTPGRSEDSPEAVEGNTSSAGNTPRYALGVHEGDELPEDPFEMIDLGDGLTVPRKTLSLSCMELGDSEDGIKSWTAQAINLLEEYGPFRLAFLETLIRLADWRASARVMPKDTTSPLERTDAA